jgi:signal transduction histidine kinase
MSHLISKILRNINSDSFPQTLDEFGFFLSGLLEQYYPQNTSYVINFKHAVDCYQATLEKEGMDECINRLNAASQGNFSKEGQFLKLENLLVAALTDYKDQVKILVVFETPPNDHIKDLKAVAAEMKDIYRFATRYVESHTETIYVDMVQLVSRISHDINSLIAMIPEEKTKDEGLSARINYSENVARDIMYYLRKITAKKVNVPLEDLLSGIISSIEFPSNVSFEVKYKNRTDLIDVDVELMDKAISAIIGNAIYASQIEGGSICMSIDVVKNRSPFINHDWLEIIVSDTGPGIPGDFMKVIKNPLFTTWKDQGHVGLGFSVTDKIIQAHQGDFIIKSEQGKGTSAIIHLPIK